MIARFNKKTEALSQLRDKAQTIDDGCDFVESLLTQVDSDLSRLEKQSKAKNFTSSSPSPDAINAILGQSQGLLESLKALTPKIEDIGNEYCFIAKQVSTRNPSGKLSQRVKRVIQDWRSYLERGGALVDLCQKRSLLSEFNKSVQGTEGVIQELLVKATAAVKEAPNQDYDTVANKIADMSEELKRVEGLRGEAEEAGSVLLGQDRSTERHIDGKMASLHKLKRNLEEKLMMLEETLNKIKTIAEACKKRKEEEEMEKEKAIQVETLTKTAIDTLSAAAAPLEVSKGVQVETLFGKKKPEDPSSDELSTSSSDVVTTTQSEMDGAAPAGGDQTVTLTRVDIYLQELLKAIEDSQESMTLVENLVGKEDIDSSANETVETDSYESLVRALANTQSMVDHVRHLHQLLVSEHKVTPSDAKAAEVEELIERLRNVEEKARAYGQKLRESSPASKQVTCPVCTPSQRGAWDSTLWRLEQWLNHADAKLKQTMKKRPPTSLEQLEEAILTHRELVLDLDSHRSLVSALTGVLTHLGKHEETRTMGQVELDKLRDRLKKALEQWKKVCHRAAAWQARLQIALIENQDFHLTITQYEEALNTVQITIHKLEPVDLGQSRKIVVSKLRKFTVSSDYRRILQFICQWKLLKCMNLFVGVEGRSPSYGTRACHSSSNRRTIIYQRHRHRKRGHFPTYLGIH